MILALLIVSLWAAAGLACLLVRSHGQFLAEKARADDAVDAAHGMAHDMMYPHDDLDAEDYDPLDDYECCYCGCCDCYGDCEDNH